jgi:hypothetical protein
MSKSWEPSNKLSQTRYDLEVAEDEIAYKVERDVRPLEAASSR